MWPDLLGAGKWEGGPQDLFGADLVKYPCDIPTHVNPTKKDALSDLIRGL